MKHFLFIIILFTLVSFHSFAQRSLSEITETIHIESKIQQKSRGEDININQNSTDFCAFQNSESYHAKFKDLTGCVRIENTTELTITIYINGDFYATVPPLGLLDAYPPSSNLKGTFYAVAYFEDKDAKTWGPWDNAPNSCQLYLLE